MEETQIRGWRALIIEQVSGRRGNHLASNLRAPTIYKNSVASSNGGIRLITRASALPELLRPVERFCAKIDLFSIYFVIYLPAVCIHDVKHEPQPPHSRGQCSNLL
jgi:hypothetical protein